MARSIGFEKIGAEYTTFKLSAATKAVAVASGASAVEGKAVAVTGNGEVGFGSDNDKFFGIIDKYEDDGNVTVQFDGFKEGIPGVSGSVPTFGTKNLVVNGSGSVKASGVDGKAMVIASDASSGVNTVTILIG
jgi:hypothetical protein